MSFRGCRRSKKLPKRKTALRERAPGTKGLGKREVVRRLKGLGLSIHDDPAIQSEGLAIVERLLEAVRGRQCLASGLRTGQRMQWRQQWWSITVQAAHLGTRGAFYGDFGNVVPLVDLLHQDQQHDGAFFTTRGIDVFAEARRVSLEFLGEHLDDARWLLAHANDGDVLALAREVVG